MGLDIYTWAGWAGWVGQLTEGIDRGTDGRSNALRAAPGASPPPPPTFCPPEGGGIQKKGRQNFPAIFWGTLRTVGIQMAVRWHAQRVSNLKDMLLKGGLAALALPNGIQLACALRAT